MADKSQLPGLTEGETELLQKLMSSPMDLPQEFKSWLVKWLEVNPPSLPIAQMLGYDASQSGKTLAIGTHGATVATSGTTFAAGVDLLIGALSFGADGMSSYLLRAAGPAWFIGTSGATAALLLNLDGADGGAIVQHKAPAANDVIPLHALGILTPSAGPHTVNVRLIVNAGSTQVQAGVGGAATLMPIVVTIEQL